MPGSKEDVEEILASVDAEEGTVKYPITLEELRGCAEKNLLPDHSKKQYLH